MHTSVLSVQVRECRHGLGQLMSAPTEKEERVEIRAESMDVVGDSWVDTSKIDDGVLPPQAGVNITLVTLLGIRHE